MSLTNVARPDPVSLDGPLATLFGGGETFAVGGDRPFLLRPDDVWLVASRWPAAFRAAGAEHLDESHAFREELHSVILPPHAWAVGRSIMELYQRGSEAAVSAVRRDGIVGREPGPDTVFKVGDVVVVESRKEL